MTAKLFAQALAKFLLGLFGVAALLFLPAGSLQYQNGWLLLGLLFVPMFCAGIFLMLRDPARLKKRLNAREEQREQRAVIAWSGLMFAAAFIAAGLTYRFGWLAFPRWTVWLGVAVFLAAYLLYAEVLRENAFLSRTIEVQENQTVVDTGLYGVVRHPMYAATLFLFLSMGLVLGSPVSLAILLCYVPIIVRRIRNEEQVLEQGLAGYAEYKTRVKYRLFPLIW